MAKTTKREKVKSAAKRGKIQKRKRTERDWNDFHVTPRETTEAALTEHLDEDLREAWLELRHFAASLGDQRIYASHRSIMFAKSVCYAFVRPKKSYVELVIFLKRKADEGDFKIASVSKTKFSHTFKLVHRDQVEAPLTDILREAYDGTPT